MLATFDAIEFTNDLRMQCLIALLNPSPPG